MTRRAALGREYRPAPLFVALEVPADLRPRLRRLASHLGMEDLEETILHVLHRVCDRLEEVRSDE
jgi:hypothetical protein